MRASIDIGSNTVLLLVAEVDAASVRVIEEVQRAPRLGRGVDAGKNLHPDSIERVLAVLGDYRKRLRQHYPVIDAASAVVVATSAVRDAGNREAFIRRVGKETGFEVRVASGDEEAELTYRGALSVLPALHHPLAVIDIGGGSTEVATGRPDEMHDRYSFDMGSVRYTERYLKADPPTSEQLEQCRSAIREIIRQHPFSMNDETELIGVAGTVTSMATIQHGIEHYEAGRLNGMNIKLNDITGAVARFSTISSKVLLERHPDILRGRADVFLGGLLVLEGFMQAYDFAGITVSTGGIRHGALLRY